MGNNNSVNSSSIKKLRFYQYNPPVSIKKIPDSKMVDLEKSIQKHLDYNDDVRAGGRVKALKYRTMGPWPSHR